MSFQAAVGMFYDDTTITSDQSSDGLITAKGGSDSDSQMEPAPLPKPVPVQSRGLVSKTL